MHLHNYSFIHTRPHEHWPARQLSAKQGVRKGEGRLTAAVYWRGNVRQDARYPAMHVRQTKGACECVCECVCVCVWAQD